MISNGSSDGDENGDDDRHGIAPYGLAKNDFDEVTNGWA
jgi:hypothetical protein